jgi:tricorn protease
MPDTAFGGLTNFTRYYYAQVGKQAVIIDERFNGGGALATDIIEHLKRTMMSLVATRDGEDEVQPQGAIFGPKVMIINEFAGSGGDAMPNYFRRASVGKLIGKRTWVGSSRPCRRATAHGRRLRQLSELSRVGSRWRMGCRKHRHRARHRGRARSRARSTGQGPQLDRAIAEALAELQKAPVVKPKRPPYPNYHKKKTTTTSDQGKKF